MEISDAIEKIISICGADILEDRNIFLYAIEDLVPYKKNEYSFIRKIYDNDLGNMLKEAYSFNGLEDKYYNEIVSYLLDDVGLSEKKASQYIRYFPFLRAYQISRGHTADKPEEINKPEQIDKLVLDDNIDDNRQNLVEFDNEVVQSVKTIEDYRRAANSVIERLYGSPDYWDCIMEDPDNRGKIFFNREKRYWFNKILQGNYDKKTTEYRDAVFQKAVILVSKGQWESSIELLKDCSKRNIVSADFLLGKIYRSYVEDYENYIVNRKQNEPWLHEQKDIRIIEEKKAESYGNAWSFMEKAIEIDCNAAFLCGLWSYMDWANSAIRLHRTKVVPFRQAHVRITENYNKVEAIKYFEKALQECDKEIEQYSIALLEHVKAEHK